MAKVHDKFVIELAEVIKGYGNDPDVDDPFRLSEFYRFYELPEIAVSANHFKTMIPLEVVEKNAQPGWIPCTTETMPKNKSNVLTVIYIPGRQAHIRSGWYEDGLFMNDNGDTWKATDKEVVGWMYQPKLPKPYREGGQS